LLAFIVCDMGSGSSGKSIYSFGLTSSGAGVVNFGGALAFNYVISGTASSGAMT